MDQATKVSLECPQKTSCYGIKRRCGGFTESHRLMYLNVCFPVGRTVRRCVVLLEEVYQEPVGHPDTEEGS